MLYQKLIFGLMAVFILPNFASAQISEVRIGMGEFAEDFINPGTERDNGVEQSWALQGEIIFEEPDFLKWALSPQPYINGTLNLEGNTNLAGAGLLWRQSLSDKFYGDFAAGGVIHDGTTEIDVLDFRNPDGTFDFEGLFKEDQTNREFGTRLLIRTQLSLGYRVTEQWAAELFFEHLSNGAGTIRKSLIDEGNSFLYNKNDAADTFGVRVAKRF